MAQEFRPQLPAERLLVLDFGSQYTQLIARRVRELGVYSVILPWDATLDEIREFAPQGIILSGGPSTVTEPMTATVSSDVLDFGVPILGICYGMQTMVAQLGGQVENALVHEYGHTAVYAAEESALFRDIHCARQADGAQQFSVWMSHGDRVISLPEGFSVLVRSDASPFAAVCDPQRQLYAVQFHPEVTHTENGTKILENFLYRICGCSRTWKAENTIKGLITSIQLEVGQDEVILALSGGVDSSVCAALLQKAIGRQLTCIFVDNGLLRLNEARYVRESVSERLGVKVVFVDAAQRFLRELEGIAEPEAKRKIIGRVFIEIFQEQAKQLKNIRWLAQGTIYPDVIESAGSKTQKAKVIKSHHNVGGLPDTLELNLLEPLQEFFKDEVRHIGEQLGLPHDLVYRHPFPGPGLGVRILGEVSRRFADMLRSADAIFMEELVKNDLYYQASQAFAVFLPVRSVGVVGDNRAYDYVICLRAVETQDFMTAKCMRIPFQVLEAVASRIVNEVAGVSRVAYDISSKPPATIEWE